MIDYEAMNKNDTFVPPHIRDGFKLWFENKIDAGSFCMAVLSNDLKGAFVKADHVNEHHLKSIVSWLYNYAPMGSWGSEENVKNWRKGN